jgi:diphosphomevalonate decarboxylase
MPKVTVRTGSNIAFIKYWGVSDPALHLPLNSSISMTLADAHTTTTVEWTEPGQLDSDEISLDGQRLDQHAAFRLSQHLDRIRSIANIDTRARVVSQNNFPMAAGIASSASGFAALSVAAAAAAGLDLTQVELSRLARLGSGSACRSIFGGFVLWDQGVDDATSVARQLFPPSYWDLYDVVVVVSRAEKAVSSKGGHDLAHTSPLNLARVAALEPALAGVQSAITARNLAQLGTIIEQDAIMMHAVMMTSTPSLFYWKPETLAVLQAIRHWRESEGLEVYFTIDAGPNLHLICESSSLQTLQQKLATLSGIQDILICRPGPGPQFLQEHLF